MRALHRLNWAVVLGIWTAFGFALIVQAYIAHFDEVVGMTKWEHQFSLAAQMYRAWIWAGLTPFVFALRREIQARHPNLLVAGSLHLLASVALLLWCNIVRMWILALSFGGWELRFFTLDNVFSHLGPFTIVDFYLYWVVLGAGILYDMNWERRISERHEEQLRTQLVTAELSVLRQQMQPHFLFNSLNAISSLTRAGESERAVEALSRLSTLLRDLMSLSGQQMIELRKELSYADRYLAVEKVRYEGRLVVRFEADDDCMEALVPSLILQPLVENAVTHGVAQRRNPCRVTISGQRVGANLRLKVSNDSAEVGRNGADGGHSGLGLSATQLRLEHMFGPLHRFDCSFGGPDGTVVLIEMPLRY